MQSRMEKAFMKISKWVDVGQEVDIEIGVDDIRATLQECFSTVTTDRLGVSVPNHYEVSAAFNAMANFLNALTDEHITALSITQRDVIHNYLTRSAERFKKKYPASGGG